MEDAQKYGSPFCNLSDPDHQDGDQEHTPKWYNLSVAGN